MAASYATLTDLVNLGLPSEALETLSSDIKSAALDAASSTAASYLRKRYSLPLTSWSTDLTRAVVHIACFDLLCNRGFNPNRGADASVQLRHDNAILWLRDVSKGLCEPEGIVDSTDLADEASPEVSGVRDVLFPVESSGISVEDDDITDL